MFRLISLGNQTLESVERKIPTGTPKKELQKQLEIAKKILI
jgi:hypothetical protein